jgi:hypothetical protein
MKDNKNQMKQTAADKADHLTAASRELELVQAPGQSILNSRNSGWEELDKWNRRHSFDDNGGGYAGL